MNKFEGLTLHRAGELYRQLTAAHGEYRIQQAYGVDPKDWREVIVQAVIRGDIDGENWELT